MSWRQRVARFRRDGGEPQPHRRRAIHSGGLYGDHFFSQHMKPTFGQNPSWRRDFAVKSASPPGPDCGSCKAEAQMDKLSHMDDLIMLLSADWFRPYWSSVGLLIEPEATICLQQGCRDIVKEMIGRAKEYYHIDFSDERLERTESKFWELLRSCKAGPNARNRISALIGGEHSSKLDEATSCLLVMVTEQLIGNSIPEADSLSPIILMVIRGIAGGWCEPEKLTLNFADLCGSSTSAWDEYLRALTPDIPKNLGHYASSIR